MANISHELCLLAWGFAAVIACNTAQPKVPRAAALDDADTLSSGFTREPTDDSARWLYRFKDLLFEGDRHARFAVVPAGKLDLYGQDTALRDTLFQDGRFMIRGAFRRTDLAYQRYESKYRSEQYPATIYRGALADPVITSDPNAHFWRTVICRDCEAQGVNFAGHYTIAEWGCGAMCQILAVVDRIHGQVYFTEIPFDTLDGHYGAMYAPDSRMIIVNSELAAWRPGYRVLINEQWPSTYAWNEEQKRFELLGSISAQP